jgi:hypothetical protein
VKRCPGWPIGSCLTNIEAEREMCSFCTRTQKMLLGCAREDYGLRHSAMLNQRAGLHARRRPDPDVTVGVGSFYARVAVIEQGPETMAAARPAAARPRRSVLESGGDSTCW